MSRHLESGPLQSATASLLALLKHVAPQSTVLQSESFTAFSLKGAAAPNLVDTYGNVLANKAPGAAVSAVLSSNLAPMSHSSLDGVSAAICSTCAGDTAAATRLAVGLAPTVSSVLTSGLVTMDQEAELATHGSGIVTAVRALLGQCRKCHPCMVLVNGLTKKVAQLDEWMAELGGENLKVLALVRQVRKAVGLSEADVQDEEEEAGCQKVDIPLALQLVESRLLAVERSGLNVTAEGSEGATGREWQVAGAGRSL
eukprot:6465635-Amphidinium_carterae.2